MPKTKPAAAAPFDLSQFLADNGVQLPQLAPAPAPTPAPAPKPNFDLDQFIQENTDQNGEVPPWYASGGAPELAINQSPVDVSDRLKMSVGNKAGQVDYLKQRYEDAAITKSGTVTVKSNNKWYVADPEGLGSGDAWQRTKELLSDLADIAPEAGAAAATVGAALATGGASLAVQAAALGGTGLASGAIRTSLGRAIGTYSADPYEQLTDIAFEGLLNAGGVFVAPAVRFGSQHVVRAVSGISKFLSGVKAPAIPGLSSEAAKDVATEVLGNATGIGGGNLKHIAQQGPRLATLADKTRALVRKAGGSLEDEINLLQSSKTAQVKKLVTGIADNWGSAYKKSLNQFLGSVDDGFNLNSTELYSPLKSWYSKFGIIDDAGKFAKASDLQQSLAKLVDTGTEAEATVARRLLQDLQSDPKEAYNLLRSFVETSKPRDLALRGVRAAEAAIDYDKQITRLQWDSGNKAFSKKLSGIGDFFGLSKKQFLGAEGGDMGGGLYATLSSKLSPEQVALLKKGKADFASIGSEFRDLLKTYQTAVKQGSDLPYEQVANRISSGAGRNVTLKNKASDAARQFGMGDIMTRIHDREALIAMAKPLNSTLTKFGPALGVAQGLAGNPMIALGTAASMAGTSPRLVGKAVANNPALRSYFSGLPKQLQKPAIEQGFKMLDLMQLASKLPPEQATAARQLAIQSWLETFRPQMTEQATGGLGGQ